MDWHDCLDPRACVNDDERDWLMRTSCLINNYNYAKYVAEAIDSALDQTVPFDEIVVVDDGSTDDSLRIIHARFGSNPRVKIVAKENQGQLSSFNEGFLASSGEIVFFLDADDVYEKDYLEQALAFYDRHRRCDFLFCAMTEFGKRHGMQRSYSADRQLGFTIVLTLFLRKWLGSPTSAISMRRSLLEKVLPMPSAFLSDWRICADDCLVWGASLAGAYKCYCDTPLVRYRVHGENRYADRKFAHQDKYKKAVAVNRLFAYLKDRFGCADAKVFHELAKAEFRTIPDPTLEDFQDYARIITMSDAPFLKKWKARMSVWRSYKTKNRKYQ